MRFKCGKGPRGGEEKRWHRFKNLNLEQRYYLNWYPVFAFLPIEIDNECVLFETVYRRYSEYDVINKKYLYPVYKLNYHEVCDDFRHLNKGWTEDTTYRKFIRDNGTVACQTIPDDNDTYVEAKREWQETLSIM